MCWCAEQEKCSSTGGAERTIYLIFNKILQIFCLIIYVQEQILIKINKFCILEGLSPKISFFCEEMSIRHHWCAENIVFSAPAAIFFLCRCAGRMVGALGPFLTIQKS